MVKKIAGVVSGSFGLSGFKEYGYFAFSKLGKNKRKNGYFFL